MPQPAVAPAQAPVAATPAPPAAPGVPVAGGRVTIAGVTGSASDVYDGLRAQGRVLSDQLERLEDKRNDLTNRLHQEGIDATDQAGLRAQLADVDARIASVNKQIAVNEAQTAQAAVIPGAIKPEPPRGRDPDAPPPEMIVMIVFTIFVLFPLAFAWARRLWKRPVVGPTVIPPELTERMTRLEQAVDSIAVEVERIGEGQRFVTKLFAESGARPLELPAQERAR
jgi:hypothetical protein